MIRILVVSSLFLCSPFALGSAYFECIVKESLTLNSDGILTSNPNGIWPQKNDKFIVDSDTGKILGNSISNTKPTGKLMLEKGTRDGDYYRVVTLHSLKYHIDYLEIRIDKNKKSHPFIYKDSYSHILSGICNDE